MAVCYTGPNILINSECEACERIIQLLEDNAKVRAMPCNCQSAALEKVEQMEDKLAKTFPLWPTDAEQFVRNQLFD